MVFEDIANTVELNKLEKTKSAAHVMDRFFSFVIDYLVISPFVMFALYLTFNNGFRYWKSNPWAPENSTLSVLVSICFVLYFSLIQTFFIGLWRATPGQYFLKIKFDFNEEGPLFFLFLAFFRQVLFWLSFVLLGLPFLAMMTNKKRRTFYDQIVGASVVSTKNEKVFFDFEVEFRYWKSLLVTFTLFIIFLFSVSIWNNYDKIVQRAASFADLKSQNFFCEDLQHVSLAARLQTAVALNLVNQLSDECLDKEADFVLWKQKYDSYSLAYYAKSLTTPDTAKEKLYLIESCKGQNLTQSTNLTLGCKIAHAFELGKFEELYTSLPEDIFLADILKYELSLILNKNNEVAENFANLEKYNIFKPAKKYQIIEMVTVAQAAHSTRDRQPASEVTKQDYDKILNLLEGL